MQDNGNGFLGQQLAAVLARAAHWEGSAGEMWRNVVSRRRERIPWWRRRMVWAVATATAMAGALLLVVGFRQLSSLDLPGFPLGETPGGSAESSGATEQSSLPTDSLPRLWPGRGLRRGLEVALDYHGRGSLPGRDDSGTEPEIQPGDILHLEIRLRNAAPVETQVFVVAEAPQICVWRLGGPGPSEGGEILGEAVISPWDRLSLNPGQQFARSVSLEAPAEPGWYVAAVKVKFLCEGREGTASTGLRFFVRHRPGEVISGSLATDLSTTAAGHTLTVRGVTMGPKDTVVRYTVSAVPVPCGFDLSLTTSHGLCLAMLGDGQRELGGLLCGEAVFGPTPAGTSGLIFELANLQEETVGGVVANPGPWRVEIPLTHSP